MRKPRFSGEGPWELTEAQVEKMAESVIMPALSQETQISIAQGFVERTAKSIACVLLGLNKDTTKRAFKKYLKDESASFRFRKFLAMHSGKYDSQRGKYILFVKPQP